MGPPARPGAAAPRRADPRVRAARPPELAAHRPRIPEFLAATPDVTRAELRDELTVAVARSTLWDAVRGLGRTVKQSPPAPALDPHGVVFVDETAANTRMGRRYGCAPTGQPVVGTVPHGHYKSLTFPAALRAGGPTAPQVLDGPMTGDRFRRHVSAVLVPALRPGDVVGMDPRPCHTAGAARAATAGAGCRRRYLPPDRPDRNPIARALAQRKRALRTDGPRAVPERMPFLRAAGAIVRPDECRADVRHCGDGEPATIPPNRH